MGFAKVIVVDTSALMAILAHEPLGPACRAIMAKTLDLKMSAGTFTEALIVSQGRSLGAEMLDMIEDLQIEILNVTPATARRIGAIYARWGKGLQPAGLNFGDCFAYEAAQEQGCPLLFVGDDFAKTDVRSALAPDL